LRLVDPPDGTPRAGRQRERALRFSEAPEELVVESGLGICVEGGRVPARRADAGGERPHLGHGLSGIGHEVEDELGEHGIEGLVVEGKRLGAGDPYICVRHPSAAGV
jgi:hypothetical protein